MKIVTNKEEVSLEVEKLAAEDKLKLIPTKFRIVYYKEYEEFLLKKLKSVNESVMSAYLNEMFKVYKSCMLLIQNFKKCCG